MKLITKPTLWDRKYNVFCVLIILFSPTISAQQKLTIIKATSGKADVKDGEVYQKGIWNLSPESKPDIYYVLEPIHEKNITFYTDSDSISFNIFPGNNYDFIILLNDKDTCYTRISTIKPVQKAEPETVLSNLIAPQLLRQDFTYLLESLQKEHAGLYRYKSKMELDKLYDSSFLALNHPMGQLEFAKSIMFLISSIEDAHTGTNITHLLINYYSENVKML